MKPLRMTWAGGRCCRFPLILMAPGRASPALPFADAVDVSQAGELGTQIAMDGNRTDDRVGPNRGRVLVTERAGAYPDAGRSTVNSSR